MIQLLIVSNIVLWVLCLALAVLGFALARQVGVLYERVAPAGALAMNKQLQAGSDAPQVAVQALDGTQVVIGSRSQNGRSTLLFFLSPTCPVCKTLLPALRSISRGEQSWLDVLLLSDGDGHEGFVREHKLEDFRYLISEEAGRKYGVSKLPFAALINAEGAVSALGLVNSREHIESLFEAQERGVGSVQEYLRGQHEHVEGDHS